MKLNNGVQLHTKSFDKIRNAEGKPNIFLITFSLVQ